MKILKAAVLSGALMLGLLLTGNSAKCAEGIPSDPNDPSKKGVYLCTSAVQEREAQRQVQAPELKKVQEVQKEVLNTQHIPSAKTDVQQPKSIEFTKEVRKAVKINASAKAYAKSCQPVEVVKAVQNKVRSIRIEDPAEKIMRGYSGAREISRTKDKVCFEYQDENGLFHQTEASFYLASESNQDPDNTRANKASTFESVERTVSLRRPTKPEVTVIEGRILKSALKFKKGGGFNLGVAAYDEPTKNIFQGTVIPGAPDGDPNTVPAKYIFEDRLPETAAVVASGHCEKYWSKELIFYNVRTGLPWKACWGVASADPDHMEHIAYRSAAGNRVKDLLNAQQTVTVEQCDDWLKGRGFTPVSSQGVLYRVNPGVSVEDFADARATSPDKYLWQRACWRNGFPMISFPITGPIGPLVSNAMAWVDAAIDTRNNFPQVEDATDVEIRLAESEARAGGTNAGYLAASAGTGTSCGEFRGQSGATATKTHLDNLFFYGREKARMENYLGVSWSRINIMDGKTRVRSVCDFANIAYRPFSLTTDNAGIWFGGSGTYSGWRSHATPWNSNDSGKNLGGGGSIKAVYLGDNGYGGEMIVEGGYISKTQTCIPKQVDGAYAHLYGQVWFPGLRVNDNVSFADAVDADVFMAPREFSFASRLRVFHVTAYRRDVVNARLGVGLKRFPGIGKSFGPIASLGLLDDSIIPFGFFNPDTLWEFGVAVSLTKLERFVNRACIFSNTFEVDWKTHKRVYQPTVKGGKNAGSNLQKAAFDALDSI